MTKGKEARFWAGLGAAAVIVLAAAPASLAQTARPSVGEDGTVHVPAFDLPPSSLSSPQSVAMRKMWAQLGAEAPPPSDDIAVTRANGEKMIEPVVAMMRQRYPVEVIERTMAGVPVRIFTPLGKPFDRDRVLVNLHGGAFKMCAEGCAMLESIPIAALGGYKVVSVNYRMAPEAQHPAAVQDVAAVYRELLKTYKPQHIGIYGCSAGGALTAEAAAWLPAHGLPQAGAIGIFGAGGVDFMSGNSAYIAGHIDPSFPPPPPAGQPKVDLTDGYFAKADPADPVVSPARYPEVMAKFPPTLIITGTRAMDMSPAVYTNSQLLKAGVPSTMIVGEGMGHCYIYTPTLPEAQDAYKVIIDFFHKNLE